MSLAIVLSALLGQAAAEPAPAPTVSKGWWEKVAFYGFARVDFGYTFPLKDEQLVGGNGGFRLAEFRLGLDAHPVDKLTISTSVELTAPLPDPLDPLTGRRIVDARDVFLQYDFSDLFQLRAGQFRPGYYAEMLVLDQEIPFISRSVLANGINPPEGYGPRTPLAPDRQVGVQLGSARLGREQGFGVSYAVGVFNGNGLNQLFNDNNGVAPTGRVELDFAKRITLGVNASYSSVAQGVRPNRLYTNSLSYGADVTARVWRLDLMAAFLGKRSTFSFPGLAPEGSLGVMGQVRYASSKTGLEAAVRVAWYEPSTAQIDDQVVETSAMVGWRPFEFPFRVLLQFTHRDEEAAVAYPNDSVDLMLHATW